MTPSDEKKKKKKQKNLEEPFEEENITGEEELEENMEASPAVKSFRKEKAVGPFLRSNTILTPLAVSNKVGKKVDDIIIELGVGLRPMPTKAVCQSFNELRQDIVTLLDLQKHIAQKEYQVQMFKDQKQLMFKGKRERKKTQKGSELDFGGLSDVFAEIPKKRPTTFKIDKKQRKKRKKDKEEKDL